MKKRLPFLALTALLAVSASAVPADLTALRAYATQALPRCPDSAVTVTPFGEGTGPSGFQAFQVKLTSSDQYCGTQKYLLYSPKSDQVFMGSAWANTRRRKSARGASKPAKTSPSGFRAWNLYSV